MEDLRFRLGLVRRETRRPGGIRRGSGSRGYKAPEQLRGEGKNIGPHTDVYGLSAILHTLLTGTPPELAATSREKFGRQLRVLENICAKGLNEKPEGRYRTAEELENDLRRYRRRELTKAWPVGRLRRTAAGARLWVVRNPGAAAASGLLLAFVIAVLAGGGGSGVFRL